jgi:hypothetical protein
MFEKKYESGRIICEVEEDGGASEKGLEYT